MKNILLILFSLCILKGFTQDLKVPELIGDRPDQTESAYTVPKGYFQLEDGFLIENETNEKQNISYSSVLLRYGLFDNFELRLVTEYNKVKSSGFNDISGFSPSSIGAKIHIQSENGWIPQIAFLGHINIAKTGKKEFMQDYHSAQMAVTFNHTVTGYWSVGYSLGVDFPSSVDYSIGTYTLVSGFAITEKMGAFIEAYGDFSKYFIPENKVNGGITYLIFQNFQVDIAAGFGLNESAADNYIGIGLVYLFKL
ncbi:MAG: transporter [Marinilabiliales bacterium]|nr:MAG: transporter [Marinilabiliales bacterium]